LKTASLKELGAPGVLGTSALFSERNAQVVIGDDLVHSSVGHRSNILDHPDFQELRLLSVSWHRQVFGRLWVKKMEILLVKRNLHRRLDRNPGCRRGRRPDEVIGNANRQNHFNTMVFGSI